MALGRMSVAIYNLYMHVYGGGEAVSASIAELLKNDFDVEILTYRSFDKSRLARMLLIDLNGVRVRYLPSDNESLISHITRDYDVFFNVTHNTRLYSNCPRSILVCHFPVQKRTNGSSEKAWILLQAIRTKEIFASTFYRNTWNYIESTLLRRVPPSSHDYLDSYAAIVTYSQFCRMWISRLWERDAFVIPPPVEMVESLEKENIILTVGRFYREKKQDVLIRSFRSLSRRELQGWELHLVGSTPSPEYPFEVQYYRELKQMSTGYPVYFHEDVSFLELRKLYGVAKIFWHAKGYGENEQLRPFMMEHFGIGLVEAMSAGAVPIVFGKGGPAEIVRHGVDGYTWTKLSSLRKFTKLVSQNEEIRTRLSRNSISRSQTYNRRQFDYGIRSLVHAVVNKSQAVSVYLDKHPPFSRAME